MVQDDVGGPMKYMLLVFDIDWFNVDCFSDEIVDSNESIFDGVVRVAVLVF